MHQFGMLQPIPVPHLLDDHDKLHKITHCGRSDTDWITMHKSYYDHWLQMKNHVENGTLMDSMIDVSMAYYMRWYWQRTVLYITNPGASSQFQEGFQGERSTTELAVSYL